MAARMELCQSYQWRTVFQYHDRPRARESADNSPTLTSLADLASQITLLKTLALWSLHDSDVVNNMIKESYKSRTSKEKNDTNIPLSVQPWGSDGDKRRYWLIEGQDDTPFRVYRESNPKLKTNTWWSVAGSIDDIRALAQKLEDDDGTRDAKLLAEKMRNAIPRFEATEEVLHLQYLLLAITDIPPET